MTDDDDIREINEVDALLRRARPVPADAFIARTERQLLRGRPRLRRRRTVVAGIGLTGALAAGVFGIALAGGSPAVLGGDAEVRAVSTCETRVVWVRQPVGVLEQQQDGSVDVVERVQPVPRIARRCG